jgi:hypothetical protein
LDATELARNKFKALFAAHDAKDMRASEQQQKPQLKIAKKANKK